MTIITRADVPLLTGTRARVICNTRTRYEAETDRRGVCIEQKPNGKWLVIVSEIRDGMKHAVSLEAETPRGAVGMARTLLSQSVIR